MSNLLMGRSKLNSIAVAFCAIAAVSSCDDNLYQPSPAGWYIGTWDLVLVNNVRMGEMQPPSKVFYNRFDVGSVVFTKDAGTIFAQMSRVSDNNTAATTECLGTIKVTVDGSSIETSFVSQYGASTCDPGFFTRRFDLSAASADQMTNMSTPYLFVFTRRK